MGFFDRMYSIKNQETTQLQYDEGCVRCGKLRFDYDSYHDEYVCDDCGWTMTEKPNGEIEITERFPNEKKTKIVPLDMPFEEMNKIVQEYGSAMLNCSPPLGGVADVSMLPYPKQKIKEAIIQALHVADGPEMSFSLKGGYIKLSDWQEGVGEQSIGIDLSTFGMILDTNERAKDYLERESQIGKWKDKVSNEAESLRDELEELGLLED